MPMTFIFWTIHKNIHTYCIILIFDSKPMNSFRCHNFAVLNGFYDKGRNVQYCQAQVHVHPRSIANHSRSVLILGSKHNYNIRGKGQVKYNAIATLASFHTFNLSLTLNRSPHRVILLPNIWIIEWMVICIECDFVFVLFIVYTNTFYHQALVSWCLSVLL